MLILKNRGNNLRNKESFETLFEIKGQTTKKSLIKDKECQKLHGEWVKGRDRESKRGVMRGGEKNENRDWESNIFG